MGLGDIILYENEGTHVDFKATQFVNARNRSNPPHPDIK